MDTFKEGIHFKVPWLERQVIYNVKTRPTVIETKTGTKDMQQINILMLKKFLGFFIWLAGI